MKLTLLKFEAKDGIATITLNRPEALNALNAELVEELRQALEIIAEDSNIRILILTGSEKAFAAGGDIKAMLVCDPLMAKNYVEPMHKVFNRLADFPKPTIAAISGYALGGGLELAVTCDFRIASDSASFGFPETGLGIFPAAGGSQRIPRLIGLSKAKELMFTGDIIKADRALSIGLINKVVPSTDLLTEANQLAQKLLKKAPLALRALKESIHIGLQTDLQSGLSQEIERFSVLFSSEDQKEGMNAFVEKRKPTFTGK